MQYDGLYFEALHYYLSGPSWFANAYLPLVAVYNPRKKTSNDNTESLINTILLVARSINASRFIYSKTAASRFLPIERALKTDISTTLLIVNGIVM